MIAFGHTAWRETFFKAYMPSSISTVSFVSCRKHNSQPKISLYPRATKIPQLFFVGCHFREALFGEPTGRFVCNTV